jgi:hypothetical protein
MEAVLTDHRFPFCEQQVTGERQPSRYFLFHIPLLLEKKMELVHGRGFDKHAAKVRIHELDSPVDWAQEASDSVLAR